MKKIIYLSIFILLIIAVVTAIVLNKKSNEKANIYFIQFKSFVAESKDSEDLISVVAFIDKYKKNRLDSIERIEYNDNSLSVTDFQILKGEDTPKYKIRTIGLNTKFYKEGIRKINSIKIYYKDGTTEKFPIGNWLFDIKDDKAQEKYLNLGNGYTVQASSFNGYDISYKNVTDSDILVEKIEINLPDNKLTNEKFTINKKKTYEKLIPNTKNINGFYYVKPRIKYTYKDKQYSFYPSGVLYGLIDLTQEKIDKEIKKLK